MTDLDRLNSLRRQLAPLFSVQEADGQPTVTCLDSSVVAALADGSLDAGTRARAVEHLATCSECRAAVASVVKAMADPQIRRELPHAAQSGVRRFVRLAVPLAAAAALLVVLWLPKGGDNGAEPHRGSPSPGAPVAVSPNGMVAEARVLRWGAVVGADRYRITLFDQASQVVFSAEVDDTALVLPDSAVVAPGQPYAWMVEARTGWGRWIASAPVTFTVAPRAAP